MVNRFPETENILRNSVGMLHPTTYSGFAVFDVPLPANGVIGNLGQPPRTAVNAIFGGVCLNSPHFFQPQICAVPVDNLVILPQQFRRHGDTMDISGYNHIYAIIFKHNT